MQILGKRALASYALSVLACAGAFGCASTDDNVMASRYVKAVDVTPASKTTIAVSEQESPELAGTTLEIPAGALGAPTRVTLELQRADLRALDGILAAGPVTVWGPEGTSFAGGATLMLPVRVPQALPDGEPVVMVSDAAGHVQIFTGATVTANAGRGWVKVVIPGAGRYQAAVRRPPPPAPKGEAHLAISPTSSQFGDVAVGSSSAALLFTVKNTGEAPTGPLSVALDRVDFAVTSNGCNGSLAAGETCDVGVTFTPTVFGSFLGKLTVTGTGASSVVASLGGNGVKGGPPGCAGDCLTINPASFDFGQVKLGATSSARFDVTNWSDAPVTPSLQISPAAFVILANECAVLPRGGTCAVTVAFVPSAVGVQTGALNVTGVPGSSGVAKLSGTGVMEPSAGPPPGPCVTGCLTIAPAVGDFGHVKVGASSATMVFSVANPTSETVSDLVMVVAGADAASFAIISNDCRALAPGARCTVEVTFTPNATGPRTADLKVMGSGGASVGAVLRGVGAL